MSDLNLLAKILVVPFKVALHLLQTALFMLFLASLFFIAPFYSFLAMPGYQHEANEDIKNNAHYKHMLVDFSSNTLISMDGSAYVTALRVADDYKSDNAQNYGNVPAQWPLFNVIGFFLGDSDSWTSGKGAPMYAAYAEAATTTDNLRQTLSRLTPKALSLPDAPKIGMAYVEVETFGFVLSGVCPAEQCKKEDYLFHEARDLFTPSMTAGQAEAIAEMQYTMMDSYWLLEAHANGIHDDNAVLEAAATNRAELLSKFTARRHPAYVTVALEIAYVLGVVTILIVLCIRTMRAIARLKA